MYPYPHSVNPSLRSHFDAQAAFFNELSDSMSRSFQQVGQLNMQLTQALFEQAANAGQGWLKAERPVEAISAAASRAQPAADTLRAYQQHLSRIASATQVDLTQVVERHLPETSRTARALADDVTRAAVEETNESMRQQEDAVKSFRDPFERTGKRDEGTSAQFPDNLQRGGGNAAMGMKAEEQAGHVNP